MSAMVTGRHASTLLVERTKPDALEQPSHSLDPSLTSTQDAVNGPTTPVLATSTAAYHLNDNMKAVIWKGKPYNIAVTASPRPKLIAGTADTIIRVTTAATCETDLHTYHGILGGSVELYVMGHEAIGIVIAVSDGVQKIKLNGRVVIPDSVEQCSPGSSSI